MSIRVRVSMGLLSLGLAVLAWGLPQTDDGIAPLDAEGKALNLDFETGTLDGWTATGAAFEKQPVKGDAVAARRGDMKSRHVGQFWVGTYEVGGDAPQGTLVSARFKVTHPWGSFRVAGGSTEATCVEILRARDKQPVARVSGDDTEDLKPVVVDLSPVLNEDIVIRIVDQSSGGWGHINFDHFRLHAKRPSFPDQRNQNAAFSKDATKHNGLPPEDAAREMTLPDGFKATVFAAEPDVHQPIAMALDDRGRVWIAENHDYPSWKPPEQAGKCRIMVYDDENGDGRHDKATLFADGINFISGLEVGFGGVWVGAPPYLLFIPDKDRDDKPDGPAQVLLDGWEHQDTHETLNAFIWGPDGWLYGCHGVFTHSNVGKPGAPPEQRQRLNASYWRYHPLRHEFELFAEGCSNQWGIDFDDHGQAFATACVIPHLYHVVQGGRYQRQAGNHFNPNTYDDLKTIADHRHYVGSRGPHAGNGISDQAGGGHAHCGAMVYLGGAWPAEYRNRIFFNNIHGSRINMDVLEPSGSGFVGKHGPDFILANDRASQILNLRYGPDGGAYLIDWYDRQQCHTMKPTDHDRTNGRIFKVDYKTQKPVRVDLGKLSDEALVGLALEKNDWYVRHARKILQERRPGKPVHDAFEKLLSHEDPTRVLRAMWGLHATGGLTEALADRMLGHASAQVRGWAIQLACEERKPSEALRARFAALAKDDPSPVVRLYLASAAGRLPLDQRGPILDGLLGHAGDAQDQNLPLMIWYAVEPLAGADVKAGALLAAKSKIPRVREFIARRMAAK
jgi:putative membrane-bound dehydrogenase-like protein